MRLERRDARREMCWDEKKPYRMYKIFMLRVQLISA